MTQKLGASGRFPDGQLGPHDEGELTLGVTRDSKGMVHINFGKDVSWLALSRSDVIGFIRVLAKNAGLTVEIKL